MAVLKLSTGSCCLCLKPGAYDSAVSPGVGLFFGQQSYINLLLWSFRLYRHGCSSWMSLFICCTP